MAKDAKKTPEKQAATSHTPSNATAAPESPQGTTRPSSQQQYPAVAPSTVTNIAVHSLLMILVPFALFFASLFGALDPVFKATGGQVPRQETKTYIGAGLAVLGVNLVIASFVVTAFREDSKPPLKQD
eukprot:GHRQ01005183.1.p2 GENE.GHRQ01005183.1~~GHRQ01005183.1.p2  ORF type:complete len:128 (+),score=33.80 GHRQ01005183.1:107-490(+)